MERFSHHELSVFDGLLKQLYAETDIDSFRTHLVRSLQRLVPNDLAHHNEFDRADNRDLGTKRFPENIIDLKTLPIFFEHIHEHPVVRAHRTMGRTDVLKCSDFLTQKQYEKTAIYNEYYRLYGFRFQMGFFLDSGDGLRRACGLLRTRSDFTERDRAVLNLLRPHVGQAWTNLQALNDLRNVTRSLQSAHSLAKQSVMILNAENRVTWIDDTAAHWLEKFAEEPAVVGRLAPESIRRWLTHQKNAEQTQLHSPLTFRRNDGHLTLSLASHSIECATLLLKCSAKVISRKIPLVSKITARENDVLHWIAQGKTNSEIALILAISVGTIYRHVENIFRKLGVNNRTSAVMMAREAEETLPSE